MKDVITGPGEYRMRNGYPWHCAIIIKGVALGYTLDSVGEISTSGCRYADTGRLYKNKECSDDILPPEPVITGPGPYETRDGGTFHCAFIDSTGIAHGYRCDGDSKESFYGSSLVAKTGMWTAVKENACDVIRKRVTP